MVTMCMTLGPISSNTSKPEPPQTLGLDFLAIASNKDKCRQGLLQPRRPRLQHRRGPTSGHALGLGFQR